MNEKLRNQSIKQIAAILSTDPEFEEFQESLWDMKGKIFEKIKNAKIVDEEAVGSDHDYFVNRILYETISEWF